MTVPPPEEAVKISVVKNNLTEIEAEKAVLEKNKCLFVKKIDSFAQGNSDAQSENDRLKNGLRYDTQHLQGNAVITTLEKKVGHVIPTVSGLVYRCPQTFIDQTLN
ncbi:MAG: hypothetical protein EOP09_08005 [Proteobacteria bacterium]|nr:MAG: hypothetical protein EOP09_08005 [Pseudomonadota bacterium]